MIADHVKPRRRPRLRGLDKLLIAFIAGMVLLLLFTWHAARFRPAPPAKRLPVVTLPSPTPAEADAPPVSPLFDPERMGRVLKLGDPMPGRGQ